MRNNSLREKSDKRSPAHPANHLPKRAENNVDLSAGQRAAAVRHRKKA
jgi:hypothetical protein